MELTGLNDFLLFLYGKDNKLLTDPANGGFQGNLDKHPGVFKVDLASSYGAVQANITGLAATAQKVYGSNATAEQHVGALSPQAALTANDIPHDVYNTLIGLRKDTKLGGYAHDSNTMSRGGVIIHSHNDNRNIDLYFAFPLGIFTAGELNLQTNNQNPNVVHDALTLAAQERGTDNLLYEKFYSTDDGFDYDQMIDFITGASTTDPTSKGSTTTTPASGSQTSSHA